MQIRQGNAECMVGFVETRLRVALTTGQCAGGPLVTDRDRHLVGAVLLARKTGADVVAADAAMLPVEYEVIVLAPDVGATDVLPTGRHLRDAPALAAQRGLPVCQFRVSAGQTCGLVGPVSNGRFAIAGAEVATAVDNGDFGGPVYALTEGNGAAMVGLFEGSRGSAPELESWRAVMAQLYIDCRTRGGQRAPVPVRLAGAVLPG